MPDGNNTITAKVIKNNGYGYFPSTPDGSTYALNEFRLSDNVINSQAGYPLSLTTANLGYIPSQSDDILMGAGSFTGGPPSKYDISDNIAPVDVINYPGGALANVGAFSPDGNTYFSPDNATNKISVVDVPTNTWEQQLTLPGNPITAWASPGGKIYVGNHKIDNSEPPNMSIIDPDTLAITSFALSCNNESFATTATFSQDISYPYYFVHCFGDAGKFKTVKLKISDNSEVGSWSLPNFCTNRRRDEYRQFQDVLNQ